MGKFVYKNEDAMRQMHAFYDRTLEALGVPYTESVFDTTFGQTHSLLVGDSSKPAICTIHGGNGITTLNLKLFLPLLEKFCIISPDVVGMPGKSAPYRNMSSSKDEFGLWIKEVLDHYDKEKMSFVVSSYSSAMLLSFASRFPERVDKSVLLVPSGFAHGPIMPIVKKTVIPFMKYYYHPDPVLLDEVLEIMGGGGEEVWREFFHLMMSSYKMEMRPPKEYKGRELAGFDAPVLIIASETDVFFPAGRVFKKAHEILRSEIKEVVIDSKHLPSKDQMTGVCEIIEEYLG